MNASLVRVRRGTPCPICDKPDWCSVSEDGAIVICMRVSDGSFADTKDGLGHIHRLKERAYPINQVPTNPEPPPVAPPERRDAVYRALLEALPLASRHRADLQRRGLSPLTIELNAYASLPAPPSLCEDLARRFNLANVPGFYRDDTGRWTLAAYRPGFLIPVRDTQGRIQACQIRQDRGARYIWLSSPDLDGGASSGAPVHFARPWRAEATGEAIITEGALKADVAVELLDVCLIAVPGVAAFGVHFGAWLRGVLPKLSTAFVAYDSDWRTNSAVSTALGRLFDSLAGVGLEAVALDWNGAKGVDDFVTEGARS